MNAQKSSFWCCAALAFSFVLVPSAAQAGEGHQCPEPLDHCVRAMAGKAGERGWVGIEMERPEGKPYLVLHRVIPGSPAEAAGLKPGDELVALNGIDYLESNGEKLQAVYKTEMVVGNTITYTIVRDGKRRDVQIHLAQIPEAVLAQWIGNHVLRYHQLAEQPDPPRKTDASKP